MATGDDTLRVRVNDRLTLIAGRVTSTADQRSGRAIHFVGTPETPMIDQVLAYLNDIPNENRATGVQVRYLGVGLAALAVRWGTYLATLMDPAAPFHETIPTTARGKQSDTISYVSQTEMKRLNIEVSYNLARLGKLLRASPDDFYSLLSKAYVHLPFPVRTVKPDRELEASLWRTLLEGSLRVRLARQPEQASQLSRELGVPLDAQGFSIAEIGLADPDRIIGNYLAQAAWRNTVVEDYHAGVWPDPPLLPHQRRFSQSDERLLLKEIGNNMAVVVRLIEMYFDPKRPEYARVDNILLRYPETATAAYNISPLIFHAYPHDWTVEETSSVVTL